VIRPGPQQLGLDLHATPEARPPVDPRSVPGVRVDRLQPAARDGDEWLVKVLAVARDLARDEGSLTPSRLRQRCATLGLKPPHQNHWGMAWGLLKAQGWHRGGDRTSRTATRNAARESVWLPPEATA